MPNTLRLRLITPLRRLAPFSGALAVACMVAAALLLHPDNNVNYLLEALGLLVVGCWLLALGNRYRGSGVRVQENTKSQLPITNHQPPKANPRLVLIGALLLFVLAENNALRFMPKWFDFMSYHVQFVLFVVGVALVVVGLGGRGKQSQAGRLAAEEWLLLVALFIVALVPRVVALDTLTRTLVDEIPWVDGIRELWWRGDYELLRPMSGTFPFTMLFPYVEAGFVEVFGRNLVGLRLASSVTGALTVIALYALARHLFDRTTAFMAAFLLAVFPPHIHFSRLALLNMVDALPGTLALAWAARGLRYDRRLDWALAGGALGMTHYFFEAGRLLYMVLMAGWLGWLFVVDRPLIRARLRGISTMTLAFILIALPVYYVSTANGTPLAGRLEQSRFDMTLALDVLAGNRPPEELLNHVLTPFLMYINRPDTAGYYGGDQALLLTGVAPLALLGAAFVLLHPRRPSLVIMMCLIAVSLGNVLLKNPSVAARYIIALPMLALLIAVGLRETTRVLGAQMGNAMLARILRLAMVLALPILAIVQLAYYFGPHLDRFNEQNRIQKLYGDVIDVALRAHDLPANTHTLIIGEPQPDNNVPAHFLDFLGGGQVVGTLAPAQITPRYLAELPTDRPYAFFVEAGDAHTLRLLLAFFTLQPARISPYYADIPRDRQYILYYAPVGSALAVARIKTPELQIFTPPAE
jgi:hypothetical protein